MLILNPNLLKVYFIMGTSDTPRPLEVLEEALEAGITLFQFREKGEKALTGAAYEQFARDCQRLCQSYGVLFIVNDDVDLAVKLNADGVHIGQDDEPIAKVRNRMSGKLVGVSAHTQAQIVSAVKEGADYVGIGPIYPTISKTDAKQPMGVAFLKQVAQEYCDLPIVAIGGINEENAATVVAGGADGVAVISVICRSQCIKETVRKLKGI